MAKKRNNRERPTVGKLNELRMTIDGLQRQVNRSTALLTDIQATDAKVLEKAIKQADGFIEVRGLLHSILDELGPAHASPLANKARRFLGRPEIQLKSSIQTVLEQHAKANAELSLAS